MTILLVQSVGSVSLTRIFFFSRSSNFALTSLCSAIHLGACCTGVTSGSTVRFAFSMCPRPLNRSLKSARIFYLVSSALVSSIVLTSAVELWLIFSKPSVSHISADNSGLLSPSTT